MHTESASIALLVKPGFTFFDNSTGDGHLYFVASYQTSGADGRPQVMVMNFTDIKHDPDRSCVIHPGEHQWVKKTTGIAWPRARVMGVSVIVSCLESGDFESTYKPLSKDILNRVMAGARITKHLTPRNKNFLRAQALIPYNDDPLPFDDQPFK